MARPGENTQKACGKAQAFVVFLSRSITVIVMLESPQGSTTRNTRAYRPHKEQVAGDQRTVLNRMVKGDKWTACACVAINIPNVREFNELLVQLARDIFNDAQV